MGLFTIGIVDPRADSIGRCNTLILEAVVGRKKKKVLEKPADARRQWTADRALRAADAIPRSASALPRGSAAVLAVDRDRGSPQLRRQRRLVCQVRLDFGSFRHAGGMTPIRLDEPVDRYVSFALA